jgi:hypothetical protein
MNKLIMVSSTCVGNAFFDIACNRKVWMVKDKNFKQRVAFQKLGSLKHGWTVPMMTKW